MANFKESKRSFFTLVEAAAQLEAAGAHRALILHVCPELASFAEEFGTFAAGLAVLKMELWKLQAAREAHLADIEVLG